jgi:hypothetical protein
MKTPNTPHFLLGPVVLLVLLFVAGSLAGHALGLPLPAPLVGLGLVLLGVRLGVMAAAIEEPAGPRAEAARPGTSARKPALHGARG